MSCISAGGLPRAVGRPALKQPIWAPKQRFPRIYYKYARLNEVRREPLALEWAALYKYVLTNVCVTASYADAHLGLKQGFPKLYEKDS